MTDVVERGWPLVRPLYLHYGAADATTWTLALQYLIGDEMMVAPVVTAGAVSVRVYFPIGAGSWTAVFDPNQTVYATPGWVEVDAPIGRPAVFVRTGAAKGARFVRALRERGVI
jgi:alpha-glucosidase